MFNAYSNKVQPELFSRGEAGWENDKMFTSTTFFFLSKVEIPVKILF